MELYTSPGYFIDSDSSVVQAFAEKHTNGLQDKEEQAIALYYAVRDGWRYNPYLLDFRPAALKASTVYETDEAHCLGKAILLAASLRHMGIPSRLHFYQVQNHLGTSRLEEFLKTNVLVFHGATEIWLHDRWVTATPAFNKELCEKLGVDPLEFNGREDSIFQAYAREKGKFMEYLHDYGAFHDLPYEYMLREFRKEYGEHLHETVATKDSPVQVSGLNHFL